MTKEEISKIKEHIEIHARREPRAVKITEILWRAVGELEHIAELEKENTGLKLMLEALEGETPWKDIKDKSELIKENAELKEKCEDLEIENAQLDNDNLIAQDVFKENAELKEQNKKLLESCEGATMMYEDLCKTKELLKDITSSYGSTEVSEAQLYFKIKKAELFLSEVEK